MKKIEYLEKLVNASNKIVITTHIVPDGDGIGSMMALYYAFKQLQKEVYCVIDGNLDHRYSFLDPDGIIIKLDKFNELYGENRYDLLVAVDVHSDDRIGEKLLEIVARCKNKVYIDHHPCLEHLHEDENYLIDPMAAATGELVAHILLELKYELTHGMAMALYTAILIDTSSFRYPNVTHRTHCILSKLLKAGVNPAGAYNMVYGHKSVKYLRLLGKILSNVKTSKDNILAWIIIDYKLLDKYECRVEDIYSFVNYLLILKDAKIAAMFLNFKNNNQTKVSFRSLWIDVGEMAQKLGGGGHEHASAIMVEGSMKSVEKQVTSFVQKYYHFHISKNNHE